MPQVDVAINVYGKPMQTAVALLTLLQHSGQHIGRIWFIEERRQPFGARFDALKQALHDRLVVFKPTFHLGLRMLPFRWLYHVGPVRRSLRYQVAWERSERRYLFLLHNDVLFHGDLIGAMLDHMPGPIAVGPVGQCWNCSAHSAGQCSPERFMDFRPTYQEWLLVSTMYPGRRSDQYDWIIDARQPWPLPECRVNEWATLIDLDIARPATLPNGPAVPLGAMHDLDIGTAWFHTVLNQGHRVQHFAIEPYARHAWASSTGGGHAALSDPEEYDRSEERARVHLSEHFPRFLD